MFSKVGTRTSVPEGGYELDEDMAMVLLFLFNISRLARYSVYMRTQFGENERTKCSAW